MSGKKIGQTEFKGRCINFELWYTEDHEQNLERITLTLEKLIRNDIDDAVRDGCNAILGLLLYEGFLYKNTNDFYDFLKRIYDYGSSKGIKKFVLVCGIVWDYQAELDKRNLLYDIIPFDYSAFAMWQSYKNYAIPYWNKFSNRFLYLGGVPSRTNRILLLSKFYDKGYLDPEKSKWSFFPPFTEEDKILCRNLLEHYSDDEYGKFLVAAENQIDERYSTVKKYSRASGIDWKKEKFLESDFFKDPNYINKSVFESTSISVIAEGHVYAPANDYRFLTEKTWRAVVNRHPFIMADNLQRKEFAKSLGLDLFEDFFRCQYDDHYHLDGVVDNVEHFLKIKNDCADKILEKIEHNFRVFFQIINNNESILFELKNTFDLKENEITYWFRQKSFDHLFRIPNSI